MFVGFETAEGSYKYSLKLGFVEPENKSPLNHFWKEGFSLGVGYRPFGSPESKLELWLAGEGAYFSFNKESSFPLDSYARFRVVNLKGDAVYTYYIQLKMKFLFRNPAKKVVPYLTLGNGFFHRSKTVLKMDFHNLQRSELNFTNAYGGSLGLGVIIEANEQIKYYLELNITFAETKPSPSDFVEWSVGILLK